MSEKESLFPARCSGCDHLSEPRRLGQTPPGWKRGETLRNATFAGQGHYFCESCWHAVRQEVPDFRVIGDDFGT